MRLLLTFIFIFSFTKSFAHEMTPAYPKFSNSYINNVSTTKMKLFNKRKLGYNKTILFDIYVQTKDIKHVVYICTVSKNFKQEKKVTLVASRICSKID